MKLTIGMATYDDFDGCYFTLQSLRLHHDLRDVELIVVDNKPDAPSSAELKQKVEGWMQPLTAGARYVPFGQTTGPALAKDRVFREARGEAVLCIDSHVLLAPGAVQKLIAWYDAHPGCRDLVQGPLLLDHLAGVHTHFVDRWRGEMWGIWGSAWEVCPGGDRVSVVDDGTGRAMFLALEMNGPPLTASAACGQDYLPDIPYAGHEKALLAAGWRPLGLADDDVIDIPGQGMGLFSCRREAWPGFNEHFRGFGGEEMYIHEKFRRRGDRCLSLGFLKWLHKFARPGGVKYPLTRWNKVRNYVLGHQELGLALDRVHEHFVASGLFPAADWNVLVADPVKNVGPPAARPPQTVAEIYQKVYATPWSLDQHMPDLVALASGCAHVTEFSHTKESLVAFAYATGAGQTLVSYNTAAGDPLVRQLHELLPAIVLEKRDSPDVGSIDETDLLFIDTRHTKARLAEELGKYARSVRRYIVLHDTLLHGQRGEDGGPGLLEAIKEFFEDDCCGPWFVASHTPKQYGLTVLGRLPEDRPEKEILLWPPGFGPGTELKAILETLGIEAGPTCDCRARATQMDVWGVDGCREHREVIIAWMREGQGRWGWKDKLAAATKAVQSGLAFKLNPLDPFPSLIDEAIRRAEEKGKGK